jgi:biopolymer transport protein TolR
MGISTRRRKKGQFQHQRDPDGGRDAGSADHLHGHHPHAAEQGAVDMAKVDNPTSMPDADKEDAIVVAITRDGAVFLGQNKVALSELGGLVRDKLSRQAGEDDLCARGCAGAVRAVEDAIDAVRTAGVDDVGLLTQKKEPGSSGGE